MFSTGSWVCHDMQKPSLSEHETGPDDEGFAFAVRAISHNGGVFDTSKMKEVEAVLVEPLILGIKWNN